jgi:lysophospholipid acyltransferase (LPLAT)-like uncharacterized protein
VTGASPLNSELKPCHYNIRVTSLPSEPVSLSQAAGRPQYSLRERFLIWLIGWVGYVAVWLIGRTLRFTVHIEEGGPPDMHTHPLILCFWHRGIFPSTWAFRNQQIGVLSSVSFDGEYTARIISRFGYMPIKGSSTRGGVRAFLTSRKRLRDGLTVAATTDGPRGPVYVAKPGPVLLASKSGVPLVAFHIALENPWTLNSWDKLMIPKPFSRAFVCMSRMIRVPGNADQVQLDELHADLQAAQERVRNFAEENVTRMGKESPANASVQ